VRADEVQLAALRECEQVRLILVQFRSSIGADPPELFLQQDAKGARFEWKRTSQIKDRADRFWSVLNSVRDTGLFGPALSLIAFPEYAVPKEAHVGLQAYADESNCIVVPGSFYETDPTSDVAHNNVTCIYIPHAASPIKIVKRHGFQEEAEALAVSDKLPNIVHLIGGNKEVPKFSITVAICRDYLMPYKLTEQNQYTSVLDWANPGLNLVIMCSSQMSLFEGRGAFDVRGLPGARRITALCNVAGIGIEGKNVVGSAILGPRADPDSGVGDIIESLRGEEEGLIVGDLLLTNPELARVEWKPDKKVFVPVKRAEKFRINNIEDAAGRTTITLTQIEEPAPAERGVWHPAFLEHLDLRVVMELFTTRQYERLKDAIDHKKIKYVSAFAIEGKYDILIRYYTPARVKPSFRETLFSTLDKDEFDEIFAEDEESAQIVIAPEHIIKFRTMPVRQKAQDKRAWSRRRSAIEKLIPTNRANRRRRKLLERICRLSRNWNDPKYSQPERDEVSDVFFDSREQVPPISSYDTGRTNLREKYVLISVGDPTKRREFETEVINKRLLPLPEVRSIYRINDNIDGTHFDYWIDIFAEPWENAEIVLGIGSWGNDLNLPTGTRTMEVLKFHLLESVEGVHATDHGHEVHLFLADTRRIDEEIWSVVSSPDQARQDVQFLQTCSMGWYDQQDAPEGPDADRLRRSVRQFYCYLFWGNVADDIRKRSDLLMRAGAAWHSIFQHVEAQYTVILAKHTNYAGKGDVWKFVATFLKDKGVKSELVDGIGSSVVELVFQFVRNDSSFSKFPLPIGTVGEATRYYKDKISRFRNKMAHANESVDYLQVLPHQKMPDGWDIDEIVLITARLIELLNAGQQCLDEMTKP
jgi:hypothetical protein